MKRFISFLLFLVIGLIVFLIIMARVGLESVSHALALFLGYQGLSVIFLAGLFIFLGIIKWKVILKGMGFAASLKQAGSLWLLGYSISYLTPFSVFGGEIFRMYFAKKKIHGLSQEKSIASVAVDKILDATVFFVFLILGLLVFAFYGRFPSSWFGIGLFASAGVLLALLFIFYIKRLRRESAILWVMKLAGIKNKQPKFGCQSKNSRFSLSKTSLLEAEKIVFDFFSIGRKGFVKAVFLTIARYLVHILECGVLIYFLTGQIAVFKSLAVYGFATLAALTPMPATIGAFELGEGIAFRVLGFGFKTGTVFSMVWRAGNLTFCLIGLLFLVKFSADLAQAKLLRLFGIGDGQVNRQPR